MTPEKRVGFPFAMSSLLSGDKISRSIWDRHSYLVVDNGRILLISKPGEILKRQPWIPTQIEIFAEDWVVLLR